MGETLDIALIMDEAGGFSPSCYPFIRDGLAHTVEMIHGGEAPVADLASDDESRHVNGQQLCFGLRDYGVERYGLLARDVLTRWGISKTEDFGKIIFAMVEAGLMRKTDEDTLEDFRGVYDFEDAFDVPQPTSQN
ncbi:MAG: hypothetical protein DHS20C14_22350 [Phycisphaeraceae bacterium]|nr:MAG: hypothetical protein DHS20C14_22350 [Phycisphaeraceae bacterium]